MYDTSFACRSMIVPTHQARRPGTQLDVLAYKFIVQGIASSQIDVAGTIHVSCFQTSLFAPFPLSMSKMLFLENTGLKDYIMN